MISTRSLLPIVALSLFALVVTPTNAAPVTVNGAQFDAPASCFLAEGALVCKLDGQQFELWITRKPLAPEVAPTESLANKMTYFSGVHENALATLLRTTGNESSTPFSSYGTYSALGALLPGKGAATSPAVRFASVLHAEEIWEFVEIVATRSPAIEALASALEASLKLPAAQPSSAIATPVTSEAARVTVATPTAAATAAPNDNSPDATFNHKRLSLQYPTFLQPQVVEDSEAALVVQFKHTTRASGPHLTITLRPAQSTASAPNNGKPASLIAARKAALTQAMAGKGASVEINSLGAIKGAGFAMIGEVAGTGVESIETNFATEINASAPSAASVLSVRLTAEQKHAGEAQAAWGLLARTLSLRP